MFFEDSSNSLCRDRLRNDRIDVLSGLNSISSFVSSGLCENVVLGDSRQFTRLARRRNGLMGKEVLEYSGYCRLADTSFRGNSMNRSLVRGYRNNVFLISRGNRMHIGITNS